MRILEFLIIISELLLIIILLSGKPIVNRNLKYLFFAPLFLILLHMLLEGLRWQLVPAYLIGTILVIVPFAQIKVKKLIRISLSVLGIVLIIISSVFAYFIPAVKLPEPTGQYRVGTHKIHLTDLSREEIITKNPKDKREVMVKIWYPTKAKNGRKEPYLSANERTGFTRKHGAPDFLLSHLTATNSHTYEEPEIASDRFPVLIFSHGYLSLANNYYAFLTELVSHGYIVAHISHTYENIVTEFPDGRLLFNCDSFSIANDHSEKMGHVINTWKEKTTNATSEEEKIAATQDLMHEYSGTQVVRRWAADISFVIDELYNMNNTPGHFLSGKMNLNQLGAFGHSLGGAAAAQASIFDPRIQAAVNWDGTQFGDVADTVFLKPFMMLTHSPLYDDNPNEFVFHRKSLSSFYDVTINGTGHSNFMDIPLWIRLKSLTFAGEIDVERGISIINGLTLAFFDKHLQGKDISVFTLKNKMPEIEIKMYNNGRLAIHD